MAAKPRNYYAFVMSMFPIDTLESEIQSEVPFGAYLSAEVIEDIDFDGDEDWERLAWTMVRAIQRRVRQSGWPVLEDISHETETGPGTPLPSDPPVEPAGEGIDPEPKDPVGSSTCWNCGSNMVQTGHRTICPQGCSATPPAKLDAVDSRPTNNLSSSSGGPERPYESTRESSPPDSYPQGAVETTD